MAPSRRIRPSAAHPPPIRCPATILSTVPPRQGVTLDLSFGDVQNNGSPVAPSRHHPFRRPAIVHFELSLTLIIFARLNQCRKLYYVEVNAIGRCRKFHRRRTPLSRVNSLASCRPVPDIHICCKCHRMPVDRSPLWTFLEIFHHVEPLLSIAYNRPVWRIYHLLDVCQ